MTDIEILAQEVLEMMSLQERHKKKNLTTRYLSKKVDLEELHKSFEEMIAAQRKVHKMCCDILGIEEGNMKAYIFCDSPLGSDYSGEGMYSIITEKKETIYKKWCSSRVFANHDLTVWIDKDLKEKGVTEVYSNGVVVWENGKLTEGVASAYLAEERYYELINSDAR